jgi:hypothetical protein
MWFVVANLALFAIYRMLFLENFAAGNPSAENLRILLYGLRLDLALLGIELFLVVLPALIVGRWHPRRRRLALWIITLTHGLASATNIQFFAERNQHIWELLIANLTRPDQIYLAIEPFIDQHRVLGATVLVGSVLFLALAVWSSRGATQTVQVFQGRERRRALKWALVLLLLTNLDPLAIKRG